MGNMSYCRFRNTLPDLRDCYDNMGDEPDDREEAMCRLKLIKLCIRIAADYADEVDQMDPATAAALNILRAS